LWEIEKLGISKKKSIGIFLRFLIGAGIWNKIEPVVGAKTKLKEFKKK
jgi:hypothetical protein